VAGVINKQQAERVLRRLLKGGIMKRLPRNRKDAEILLALAASYLDPQSRYSESEVNQLLREWMEDFTCPIAMDHVTVRRYLVDFNFLLRDQPGSWYITNQTIINKVIEPAARSIRPGFILGEVQREREIRKHESGR